MPIDFQEEEKPVIDFQEEELKLSPYQLADLESMGAGRGKAPTGMEPGIEFTSSIAQDPLGFLRTPLEVPGAVGRVFKGEVRGEPAVTPPRVPVEETISEWKPTTYQTLQQQLPSIFGPVGEQPPEAPARGLLPAMNRILLEPGPRGDQGLLRFALSAEPFVPIPKLQHHNENREETFRDAAVIEAANFLIGLAEFIESPMGLTTAGAAAAFPMATRMAFAGDIAYNLFQTLPEIRRAWPTMTTEEKAKALVESGGQAALVGLLTRPETQAKVKGPREMEAPLAPDLVQAGRLYWGAERKPLPTGPTVVGAAGAMQPPALPPPAEREAPTSGALREPPAPIGPPPITGERPAGLLGPELGQPPTMGRELPMPPGAAPGRAIPTAPRPIPPAPEPPPIKAEVLERVKAGINPAHIRITVSPEQRFGDKTMPAWVQVDEIHPELGNTFSTNPEMMNRAGFKMPSTRQLLTLGSGRFWLPDAINRVPLEKAAISPAPKPKALPAPTPVEAPAEPLQSTRHVVDFASRDEAQAFIDKDRSTFKGRYEYKIVKQGQKRWDVVANLLPEKPVEPAAAPRRGEELDLETVVEGPGTGEGPEVRLQAAAIKALGLKFYARWNMFSVANDARIKAKMVEIARDHPKFEQLFEDRAGQLYWRDTGRLVMGPRETGEQIGKKPAAAPAPEAAAPPEAAEVSAENLTLSERDPRVPQALKDAYRKARQDLANNNLRIMALERHEDKLRAAGQSVKAEDVAKERLRLEANRKPLGKALQDASWALFEARYEADVGPFRGKPEVPGKQKITNKMIKAQRENLLDQIEVALKEAPESGTEKITISVPGDGEFTIINNQTSIKEFQKIAKQYFPKGVGKAKEPTLPSVSATSMPKVQEPAPEDLGKIAAKFVSQDESRFSITVAYADGTQIIATDGRRMLRIVSNQAPGTPAQPVRINAKGEVVPVESDFPNYQAIWSENPQFVRGGVPTDQLWTVANQASALWQNATDKELASMRLFLNPDGSVGARSKRVGVGEYEHNVQPKASSLGDFNPDFIFDAVDAARRLGNERVDIYFHGEGGPIEIRGKSSASLVMPQNMTGGAGGGPSARAAKFPPSPRAEHGSLPPGLGPLRNPEGAISRVVDVQGKWNITLENGQYKIERHIPKTGQYGTDRWDEVGTLPLEKITKGNAVERRAAIVEALKGKEGVPKLEKGTLSALNDAMRELSREREAIIEEGRKRQGGAGERTAADEERIRGRGAERDVFEMEEGDLDDLFDERFGQEPPRAPEEAAARPPGEWDFPSYSEFKKWMDARYAERDLEGMQLAFATIDRAGKKQFIKDVKDTGNEHLKAWVNHMATGSPLPAESPPVARTTPRPPARPPAGGTAPPAGPGGAYPQPPPPPPRRPSIYRRFDMTALVQLARLFDKFPRMSTRLRAAYGRYVRDSQIVELKKRLLWDMPLAERVLAHEIGHYFDRVVQLVGTGKQFADRVAPLWDWARMTFTKGDLRKDALNLSREWRGDFTANDRYRNKGSELFADFMSAMLNKPEWVNQRYPRLFDSFQALRDAKPAFRNAYREIETWLQGGTMAAELRAQDRASVESTIQKLTSRDPKIRAKWRDRLAFGLVSLWGRAFEKEGKPRLIGASITDKLENSYMWAAKRLTLWNDEFMKRVQPLLETLADRPPDQQHPGPWKDYLQARADLMSYSKAVRTIGERRAAGRWIEQNPEEAYEMLQTLLDADPTLKSKFQADLEAEGPTGNLYDLSARVFREVWDRGDKFAAKVAREIDRMDLDVKGSAAMMAFNVRGKLMNPGGLTPETAAKTLADLRENLGPGRYQVLEDAARNLRDLMYDVQREMHEAGLISDKVWTELIEPNRGNYLPYAVLDYFDGKVPAGVMQQKGTARDIADLVTSTQLKVASAYSWLQKQRQVQLIRAAYERGGATVPIGEALRRARDVERIQAQNRNDDVSRAVIWKDGKPHLIEFPGDPGKQLQDALNLPEFYSHIEWLQEASRRAHQIMQLFTQWSPRFILYRNIIRGFRTGAMKVGFTRAFGQISPEQFKRNYRLAVNYADNALSGTPLLPEVRDLIERDALAPPRLAAGSVRDMPNMRAMLIQGTMPVFAPTRMMQFPEKAGRLREGWRQFKNTTDRIFTGYEAFEKIANYQAALKAGWDPETAAAIARRGGIPNPGVVGKWSIPMEIMFPWTRVRFQGIRVASNMMRDPRFRKGYLARFMLTEAAPRMAKVALALAVINKGLSWLIQSDEDPEDSVSAEVFKRISPYKMALDDVIPFALFDTLTGKYHYFWEYKRGKDIPRHFEVISVRIPSSEEGQTFGTMLYGLMSAPGPAAAVAGQPGQGFTENLSNWGLNHIAPQINPAATTGINLIQMIGRGVNPPDLFRNRPTANPQLFDAGGLDRAEAIAGYTLNSLGGPGEIAAVLAANAGILDAKALDALKSRLSGEKRTLDEWVPAAGAVFSHDNYADYRDRRNTELQEKQDRAKAKGLMSRDARALYEFFWSKQDKQERLSLKEKQMFKIASYFVKDLWGEVNKDVVQQNVPGYLFYNQAMQAVGPKGSRQRRATVRRDLDTAAADAIQMFNQIKSQE